VRYFTYIIYTKVVIVPCGVSASMTDEENSKLMKACEDLKSTLATGDIRAKTDLRDNYSAGWKFNHWELKVSKQ